MLCSIGLRSTYAPGGDGSDHGDKVNCSEELMYKSSFSANDWHTKCSIHDGNVSGTKDITMKMHLQSKQCPTYLKPLVPGQKLCKRCFSKAIIDFTDINIEEEASFKLPSTPTSSSVPLSQVSSHDSFEGVHEVVREAGSIQNVICGPAPVLQKDQLQHTLSDSVVETESQESKGSSSGLSDKTVLVPNTQDISGDLFDDDEAETIQGSAASGNVTLSGQDENGSTRASSQSEKEGLQSSGDDPSYHPNPQDAVLNKINTSLADLMGAAGGSFPQSSSSELFYTKTLAAIRSKFQSSTSNEERIKLISILSVSMTQAEILEKFSDIGATDYMVRKAFNLVTEQGGILPTTMPRKGRPLSDETVKLVQDFYENEEISCSQRPGRKDYVSVKEVVCDDCPGLDKLEELLRKTLEENFVETVKMKQWTSDNKRSSLDTLYKSRHDFIKLFMKQLKDLLPHHFIAKEQSKFVAKKKQELEEGEALVLCDFAENYTCVIQDAVQDYHWTNDQVTIHPFVAYYKEEGEVKHLSHVIISDHMTHDTMTVYAFLDNATTFLKSKIKNLKKNYLCFGWCSPTVQELQKCNKSQLSFEDFGVHAEWHFFATSHGKSPCDGLSGTLKRYAYLASIRGELIRNATEFFKWAQEKTKIHVSFVSSDEVLALYETKLTSRFAKALKIKSIRKHHSILPIELGAVSTKRFSLSEISNFVPVELVRKHVDLTDVYPDSFVAVDLSDCNMKWSLCQVLLVDTESQDVYVNYLRQTNQKNRFEETEDETELSVPASDLLAILQPAFSNSQFILSPSDMERVLWQFKAARIQQHQQ
ncbi:hypothetical protein SESBI_51341 [Sesbania bispinosa]|nr:hypothetical protein SESBI_51341 [Sesbania bispinosa]